MTTALIHSIDQGEYQSRITGAIRRAFGTDRMPIKRLADAANCNLRTAKNWLHGRSTPDGLHLLRLIATIPELQAEVRRLTGMAANLDPEFDRALNAALRHYVRVQREADEQLEVRHGGMAQQTATANPRSGDRAADVDQGEGTRPDRVADEGVGR